MNESGQHLPLQSMAAFVGHGAGGNQAGAATGAADGAADTARLTVGDGPGTNETKGAAVSGGVARHGPSPRVGAINGEAVGASLGCSVGGGKHATNLGAAARARHHASVLARRHRTLPLAFDLRQPSQFPQCSSPHHSYVSSLASHVSASGIRLSGMHRSLFVLRHASQSPQGPGVVTRCIREAAAASRRKAASSTAVRVFA
mmetsp:Transcript_11112/g.33562  ORF Transcript_11112/g.33562 Transcript_11112/m.33562 type:complete len:202 (-) Transcript_11112:127-732(-)